MLILMLMEGRGLVNALDTISDVELLEELQNRHDHMVFLGIKNMQVKGDMKQVRPHVSGNPALLYTQVCIVQQQLLQLVILGQMG